MYKLLSANFARLWKSRLFWLGMAVMSGLGILVVVARYKESVDFPEFGLTSPDGLLFIGGLYLTIVIAVFIGIFIGTEYSDGTIRNKLVAGHSRISIYLSNYVVCMSASFFMHLINMLVVIGLGVPLIGKFKTETYVLLTVACCSFVTVAAFTAVYLLISMLVQSKSTGSVVAIIISILLLFWAMEIMQRLEAPEYYDAYSYALDNGEVIDVEEERNPQYLTGAKRKIYEFLYEFLPTCQMAHASNIIELPKHMARLPLYSLSIVVVSTACGVLVFRKKDLR